jgi:zinc transporter, ZIP family
MYEYSVLAVASSNVRTIDTLRTVTLTTFAGFTLLIGIYHSKKINISKRHILAFTSFGAGILMSVAIFGMAVEAERIAGLTITVFVFTRGAILFTALDIIVENNGGGAGILLGIG